MMSFTNLSVRLKLILIITIVSVLAVSVTTGVTTYSGVKNIEEELRSDMYRTAAIVGDNSRAALIFDDQDRALEILETLSSNSSVLIACLYQKTGKEYAGYFVSEKQEECPLLSDVRGQRNSVVKEIEKNKRKVGYIYLGYSNHRVESYYNRQMLWFIIILGLGVFVTVPLAALFQRSISKPIDQLVSATNKMPVAKSGVAESSKDEIQQVAQALQFVTDHISMLDSQRISTHKNLRSVVKNKNMILKYLESEASDLEAKTNRSMKNDIAKAASSHKQHVTQTREILESEIDILDKQKEEVDVKNIIEEIFDKDDNPLRSKSFHLSVLSEKSVLIHIYKEALEKMISNILEICSFSSTDETGYNLEANISFPSEKECLLIFNYYKISDLENDSEEKELVGIFIDIEREGIMQRLLNAKHYANLNNPDDPEVIKMEIAPARIVFSVSLSL